MKFREFCAIVVISSTMLVGCGTTAKREPGVGKTPSTARGGGYYLDDGPGAEAPSDLDSIPDAVPRREALHRGASRPYSVMGRDYTPMTALETYRARGIATWYGRRYHGKPTSSGELYDMYAMTAAHTTLPIPSYARVSNLANGRSVVVRINDRGPFVGGRLIDLSYTAAYKLGVLAAGSGLVDVEAIIPGVAPPVLAQGQALDAAVASAPQLAADSGAPAQVALDTAAGDPGGVYLQLGAFGSKDNAESFLARLTLEIDWLAGRLQMLAGEGLYRVRAGPYANQIEARRTAERIGEALGIRPVVLTR